eukprot:Gb_01712 [translate_table: standard]
MENHWCNCQYQWKYNIKVFNFKNFHRDAHGHDDLQVYAWELPGVAGNACNGLTPTVALQLAVVVYGANLFSVLLEDLEAAWLLECLRTLVEGLALKCLKEKNNGLVAEATLEHNVHCDTVGRSDLSHGDGRWIAVGIERSPWNAWDCKVKKPDKGKSPDVAPSTNMKTSSDEVGDVYLASSSTRLMKIVPGHWPRFGLGSLDIYSHALNLGHDGESIDSLPLGPFLGRKRSRNPAWQVKRVPPRDSRSVWKPPSRYPHAYLLNSFSTTYRKPAVLAHRQVMAGCHLPRGGTTKPALPSQGKTMRFLGNYFLSRETHWMLFGLQILVKAVQKLFFQLGSVMAFKRGSSIGVVHQRGRNGNCRVPVVSLLVISVLTPLLFLATRAGNFKSTAGHKNFLHGQLGTTGDWRRLSAVEQIEDLFPREVIDVITANTDDSGPLSLNIVGRKDLSSSWIWEKPADVSRGKTTSYQRNRISDEEQEILSGQSGINFEEVGQNTKNNRTNLVEQGIASKNKPLVNNFLAVQPGANYSQTEDTPAKFVRRQLRQQRREKRLTELIRQVKEETTMLENAAIERSKEVDKVVLGKYSIWRRDNENSDSDSTVRLIRDQLIMARVYSSIARSMNSLDIYHNLMLRIKESQRALGEASVDSDLHHSAPEKVKAMGRALSTARDQLYDCAMVTKKLRAMLQSAEEQVRALKKQSTFLSQLAAKTVPKGVHCLSMLLTVQYYLRPLEEREFPSKEKLEDPNLYHYALFSDNVLAASVVVNSTVSNAKEPEKHVFHLVTDKLNFGAMKTWFLDNPPSKATIHVENVDDFKWLNSSYSPVLHQLESAKMKEYYFKVDHPTTLAAGSSNLKYRNPKYLSMLNHLRFYLPQVYPKLDKILFLDDDIVVQKDLTPLWSINLHGKVNGAVETCGESFHRFDKYLNFSNPHIARNFDPNACGWAYGMNVFDLKEWKKRDITGIYHKWQNMNEDRVLWKLGTLPPGLITFYNLTYSLDSSWHVLGLGYNPSVERSDIDNAAVVHYNGNMKPWLELAMAKYRPYWTRYVKFDNPYLQQCNINE